VSFIRPDLTSLALPSGFGDVASYGTIFGIFALVAWMSGRRMEQSLQKALKAEAALELEKSSLAQRLEKQTRHLREVQFEEMRQLYQFAELGQVSTALLHELANHLTILTLDIDDLQQRHRRSSAITHAKESITHLDTMVAQVRKQLRESTAPTKIDVTQLIQEVIESLQIKANESHVRLLFEKNYAHHALYVLGDPLRLSQVVTIIMTNAIQAYTLDMQDNRIVEIRMAQKQRNVIITVNDWGGGISNEARKKLFEPFQSKKKNGMGIGLFIAKNMIETHFKGSISLDDRTDFTSFIIKLPKYKQ
jgi:C4-dicarboxylate-specific signal transduction histidine kinase